MTRLLTLLLAALTAACTALGGTPVEIPTITIEGARTAPKPIPARLFLPPGPGPFPALILLHGCGGLVFGTTTPAHIDQWIARVTSWGYAALTPDSFAPRGLRSVCAPPDQPKATPTDRTSDTIAATRYLQTLPTIDPTRIAVIGFSHGGATAARLALIPNTPLRATINYYGSCTRPDHYTGLPLLALAGDADDWGNPAHTCHLFGETLPPDKPFTLTTYPNAVHAFDNENARTRSTNQGHALQYDDTAAQDSYRRVKIFLERYVK